MANKTRITNEQIAKFVLEARKSMGLSQSAFAEIFNCSKGNVSAWENSRHTPAFSEISKMSDLSGVPMPILDGGQTLSGLENAPQFKKLIESGKEISMQSGGPDGLSDVLIGRYVPIISWVKAGEFEQIEDPFSPGQADEWAPVFGRKVGKHAFALRVVGDSMTRDKPPSFEEGKTLICDPELSCKPGDYVIAKNVLDQTATFKKLTYDGVHYYLMPLNPMYKPIVIENDNFRVIAKVVQCFDYFDT